MQSHEEQDAEPSDDGERDDLERHSTYPWSASERAACEDERLPLGGYQKKDG